MSGKIYTPQDIHALIERAAKSHDELAKSVPGGTDRVKAEALRRWAAVYIPVSAEPQGAPDDTPGERYGIDGNGEYYKSDR